MVQERNDELSNLVTIQNKLDKIYFINEQQVIEIYKLYDEIWRFDEPIKNSERLLVKKSNFAEGEIELIEEAKGWLEEGLECKQDLIMQEESETFEIFSDLYS